MKLEQHDFPSVRTILLDSLAEMMTEPKLFSFRINERTLTQRLSLYLQKRFGIELSVDCEYNRMWEDDADIVKRLPWGKEPIWTDDDEGRTVYPDVIVHIRGEPLANLLAIEAKRNFPKDSLPPIDQRKLEGFTHPRGDFRYRWGAFINFTTRETPKQITVHWFSGGQNLKKCDVVKIQ